MEFLFVVARPKDDKLANDALKELSAFDKHFRVKRQQQSKLLNLLLLVLRYAPLLLLLVLLLLLLLLSTTTTTTATTTTTTTTILLGTVGLDSHGKTEFVNNVNQRK